MVSSSPNLWFMLTSEIMFMSSRRAMEVISSWVGPSRAGLNFSLLVVLGLRRLASISTLARSNATIGLWRSAASLYVVLVMGGL